MLVFMLVLFVALMGTLVAGSLVYIYGLVCAAKARIDRQQRLDKVFYLYGSTKPVIDADVYTRQ